MRPENMMAMGPMAPEMPMEMPPVQPDGQPPMGLDIPPMPEMPVEEWEEEIRGDVQDWKGGKPLDLKKKMKSGKSLREELSNHVKEVLESELKNQESRIKKLKKWHDLYKAEKRGGRPKPWMADVSIPVARKISDSIFVRIHDMVWNKVQVYLFKARGTSTPEMNDKMKIWEKAFNNYVRNDMNLKEKMVFPTRQAVNSGTGVVKIVYETKNKTIYRYATEGDKLNTAVSKYRLPGTKDTVVKEPSIVFRGPNVYPLDRARFVISSDAMTIEDAYLVGFSFDKRKSQLAILAANKIYDQEAVDKLMPSKPDELTEKRAEATGLEQKKISYTEPYTLYELWLRYDVDEDGEEDDICVTFHRDSSQILKGIYNPTFYGYRPFADFKAASQVEYTYDGEGICEIIEVMSEELDTLHNLMLDRMKLANLPIVFAQSGVGLDNKELEPGKVHIVDMQPAQAIHILQWPDATMSIVNEVNWLIAQMDLVCGITPGALGIETAERPVFKATATMQQEYDRKFKSWTDRGREFYRETGYKLLEAMAQYQPTYEYTDENGQFFQVEMPTGNIREYLDLDLVVSSEEWNRTMRRETEIMRYQLLKDYLTGMFALVQQFVSPMVPSDGKKMILQINDVGARAIHKILSNFDEAEEQTAVVDIRKFLDVEKCMQNSVDIIQAQQQQAMQQEQMAKEQLAMAGIEAPPEEGAQPQQQGADEFSVQFKPKQEEQGGD